MSTEATVKPEDDSDLAQKLARKRYLSRERSRRHREKKRLEWNTEH
jgi:hypothetical protein